MKVRTDPSHLVSTADIPTRTDEAHYRLCYRHHYCDHRCLHREGNTSLKTPPCLLMPVARYPPLFAHARLFVVVCPSFSLVFFLYLCAYYYNLLSAEYVSF